LLELIVKAHIPLVAFHFTSGLAFTNS